MLSNISRWTPESTEENENDIQLSTDDYLTSSTFEQTDSSSSVMSEMDGRRIYCSGRDLHTISSVREFYLLKFILLLFINRMFFHILISPI
jgi:hypothetical protein